MSFLNQLMAPGQQAPQDQQSLPFQAQQQTSQPAGGGIGALYNALMQHHQTQQQQPGQYGNGFQPAQVPHGNTWQPQAPTTRPPVDTLRQTQPVMRASGVEGQQTGASTQAGQKPGQMPAWMNEIMYSGAAPKAPAAPAAPAGGAAPNNNLIKPIARRQAL